MFLHQIIHCNCNARVEKRPTEERSLPETLEKACSIDRERRRITPRSWTGAPETYGNCLHSLYARSRVICHCSVFYTFNNTVSFKHSASLYRQSTTPMLLLLEKLDLGCFHIHGEFPVLAVPLLSLGHLLVLQFP